MDDQEVADRLIDHMITRQDERRRAIANGLRRLADDVDAADPRKDLRTLRVNYGAQAKDILHIVFWGIANLNIDGFVGEAAELDVLVAQEDNS